ncbi:MAG TPA: prolyl oligopeptidase family serine peptidase [Usitatibacter sp.]|nr:prolyl oligopeptidase family serine peptidase [Usitatibacter sp.]
MNHLRLSAFICGQIFCLGFALAQSPAATEEDPFRHFEDAADARTQAFFRDESARARMALDRIPGRAALLERIRALAAAETTVHEVKLGGTRVFYLKSLPGRATAALYMRESLAGAERLLFDPAATPRASASLAIDGFSPAPDGRHVALGLSEGGREQALLRVIVVEGARMAPFEIDRASAVHDLAWHPDGRSFFYARASESGPRRLGAARIYRHVLGRASERDEVVFAPGVGGARDVPEAAFASLHLPADSRYAYAIARDGLRRDAVVHVTDLRELGLGKPQWRRLAGLADEVLDVQGARNDLYVLSRLQAPRHRVLRVKGEARNMAEARVVVPQGDSVIEAMALARDALYLRTMVGGVDRLERIPFGLMGTRAPEFVRIPFDNAISQLLASPRADGAQLRLQGWIEPPTLLQVDKRGETQRLALQPAAVASYAEMDEVRLYAPSHDGVKVPVTLVYRKTTRLGGDNPTLLLAHGAYGETVRATFDASRLAWLERGGVLAIAHVRGGGEYGATWHQGGSRRAKANSELDLVAAAQFVSEYGFASPRRLVAVATGAGALAVEGAVARRPELFAAVVLRAPLADLLRAEQGVHGAASVGELGSAATAPGAEALRAISPYHRVGTVHPAALLSVGANDGRVDAWHAAKLAARLQPAAGTRPVLLRVDDGGHPPSPIRAQRDEELADIYAFALWQMDEPGFQWPVPAPVPPVTLPATPPAEPPAAPASTPPAPAPAVPATPPPAATPPSTDPRNPNPERP